MAALCRYCYRLVAQRDRKQAESISRHTIARSRVWIVREQAKQLRVIASLFQQFDLSLKVVHVDPP